MKLKKHPAIKEGLKRLEHIPDQDVMSVVILVAVRTDRGRRYEEILSARDHLELLCAKDMVDSLAERFDDVADDHPLSDGCCRYPW